jgi:alpha-aminoadipate/glutamate carrier protein LysW
MADLQKCPQCEAEFPVSATVRLHDIVECPSCRSELEVVALNPVILALAPEVEEDWGE